jgi:hypothetical protein
MPDAGPLRLPHYRYLRSRLVSPCV